MNVVSWLVVVLGVSFAVDWLASGAATHPRMRRLAVRGARFALAPGHAARGKGLGS